MRLRGKRILMKNPSLIILLETPQKETKDYPYLTHHHACTCLPPLSPDLLDPFTIRGRLMDHSAAKSQCVGHAGESTPARTHVPVNGQC